MSGRAGLQDLREVRDSLIADREGRLVEAGPQTLQRQGWAATSAAAVHQLSEAGAALGLGPLRVVTMKGQRDLTAVAAGVDRILLAALDPSRPATPVEEVLRAWSLAEHERAAASGEAPAEGGASGAGEARGEVWGEGEAQGDEADDVEILEAPLEPAEAAGGEAPPEPEPIQLTPLDLTPPDPWALLRRAMARGLLAEAASHWRAIAESAAAGAALAEEHERAMQTLLEGAGTVLAGDGVGGGRHLRALATLARDLPSFQWLARVWSARAALKSGSLVAATAHSQSALRLAAELDDEARAVSLLTAAEVRALDGQDPAAQLAGLASALATFARLGDAWGESHAFLARARIEAALGQDEESAASAARAIAADPNWDEPAVFLARRSLRHGALAEAERILGPLRSAEAARELGIIAAIRSGEIGAEQASEFLFQRDAPPGPASLAAMQRLAVGWPRFLQARAALGWILLQTGKYAEADAVLRSLLEQPLAESDRASVLLGLGCIANAAKQGKPEARLRAAVGAPDAGQRPAAPAAAAEAAAQPAPAQGEKGPAGRAVFSGQLGAFALPDLLEFLRSGRRTGLLVCSSGAQMGALRFSDGSITGGSAPGVAALGELLRRAGAIDTATLAQVAARLGPGARQSAGGTSLLLGEALVREGKIGAEAVRSAVSEQIRAALRVLIQWHDGQFAFDREETDERPANATSVSLDPQGLLLDIFRELDEAAKASDGSAA